MKIYRSFAQLPPDYGPSAVTIGKFDGVHCGHRAVIQKLQELAEPRSLVTTLVTFDRHPLTVLAPHAAPKALLGASDKRDLLREMGIDVTVVLPFDHNFARLSATDFATEMLDSLACSLILVGEDFRFGAKGAGDIDLLSRLAAERQCEIVMIPDVTSPGGQRISSTRIRELLSMGDVAQAAILLGHLPRVTGEVVRGARRGRELGFPTANLSQNSEGFIPADGVYAGWLLDQDQKYPAAISVGSNPTFDGVAPQQVEAHVLDRTLDLYGHTVSVVFTNRIRGMIKFSGVAPLIEQIKDDVQQVRCLLAG